VEEPTPADEARHPPGTDPDWEEAWDFDFTTAAGDLGGYLRLALHPRQGVVWFWACLVGRRRPLVTVVAHDVGLPRGPGLDLRAEGLWADPVCETPLEHWTVGLEAFGVGLDDPTEAYRSVRGDRTALGFDLEWETTAGPRLLTRTDGYSLACAVHGEVLVGPETLAFEGWGQRSHAWGSPGWWGASWATSNGRLDDGSSWSSDRVSSSTGPGGDGLLPATRFRVDDPPLSLAASPLHHAPVRLDGPEGRTSRLARALCRYGTGDGRSGVGWSEWNGPAAGDGLR
jgi:hypothetical protein